MSSRDTIDGQVQLAFIYAFGREPDVDDLAVARVYLNGYEEKLKSSNIIVTELKFDRPKATAYYNSRPASTTLSTILSKDDIDFISTVFKNSQVDINKYSPGELFAKLQAVYPKFKCPIINVNDKWAMDEYIQQLGDLQQKTLYFLEIAYNPSLGCTSCIFGSLASTVSVERTFGLKKTFIPGFRNQQ